jgi:hypothetical protein
MGGPQSFARNQPSVSEWCPVASEWRPPGADGPKEGVGAPRHLPQACSGDGGHYGAVQCSAVEECCRILVFSVKIDNSHVLKTDTFALESGTEYHILVQKYQFLVQKYQFLAQMV